MSGARSAPRRWLAREVVQTSSMDCGPAALKCVLDGHGIEASYGRLREACQTSVDGTSIDTLEAVSQQLGLRAEQVMVPADHVALDDDGEGDDGLPAIVVVQHADLGAHFVVVWRRIGRWLQVMDPASGRRWMSVERLRQQLYRHEAVVDAADWCAWAASDENGRALACRLQALGLQRRDVDRLLAECAARPGWLPWAAADAATRLAQALVDAGGLRRGDEVRQMLKRCLQGCLSDPAQGRRLVPAAYWSVQPADERTGLMGAVEALRVRGAVVLRVPGRQAASTGSDSRTSAHAPSRTRAPLSPELAAVLDERAEPAWRTLWRLLRHDAHRAPAMLLLAAALGTVAVALELLLLRGLFDIGAQLNGGGQRLAAALALIGLVLLRPAWDAAALREGMRLGRQLDLRLRAALLARLPRLHDRYFQSRPISDMADRAHGLQTVRAVPPTVLGMVQTLLDLLLTGAGLVWLAPAAWPWALAMLAVAMLVPFMAMPALAERDLRVRTHAAALAGFYLDALLGLVPVRAHRAERAVRREHEALLVHWTLALRAWIRAALATEAVQATLGLGLAVLFLTRHLHAQGGVAGSDLLLVFWTLKVPALGRRVAALTELLPAQRNALARLMEPLASPVAAAAPAEAVADVVPAAPVAAAAPSARTRGFALTIRDGLVQAGGHDLLRDVDLQLAAGEHVAVVGLSGAGKSSLLGLMLGWHKLAAGTLAIDGRALAGDADLQALRAHIAWVDPAVQLWNRSLLDNLLYASADPALAGACGTPARGGGAPASRPADAAGRGRRPPLGRRGPARAAGARAAADVGAAGAAGRALPRPGPGAAPRADGRGAPLVGAQHAGVRDARRARDAGVRTRAGGGRRAHRRGR
ncbi:MAG: cysteine peptidase family C39 domain-containing protein [Rubrivivax sp.]